jgi:hypothetical protein
MRLLPRALPGARPRAASRRSKDVDLRSVPRDAARKKRGRMNRVTEQEMQERTEPRQETGEYLRRWLRRYTAIGLLICIVGLFHPFHAWLHAHLELLLGFVLGTLAQSVPWLVDRWRWMKWFSR